MKDSTLILVVDDNLQNIELMQAYLEPKGYKTVTATGGQEALNILAQQPVDLILLDIMMPELLNTKMKKRVHTFNA
ncbi:response regulator [Pseudoalteromonas rhizosphaerae]|uniref:Response regulator n=1 Tax=Pseudoalteromonas rhizosphaerae TaxID=2518973 RepID=A0ABW8L4F3_9GAMM